MGQPIAVTRTSTPRPGVLRFDINRTLTGMGHERYASLDDTTGRHRPPDELARRLFDSGGARSVHIYSNVVTVELEEGADAKAKSGAYADVIRSLYIHYTEGVTPSVSG